MSSNRLAVAQQLVRGAIAILNGLAGAPPVTRGARTLYKALGELRQVASELERKADRVHPTEAEVLEVMRQAAGLVQCAALYAQSPEAEVLRRTASLLAGEDRHDSY